jgi:glycosyltransferase involved in cell wall biosynthesis
VASSAAEFAAGISSLLEDPSLRGKMANDARRWVEQQYHWGKIGEKQRGICNV